MSMRIIAGEFRSRMILPPQSDQTTRPITDRVKQSLFDIISPLLEEAVVYDCFAGTGSMGLESLSRGARRTVFFESDRPALARLRKNIGLLGVEKRSLVIAGDLFEHFGAVLPLSPAERVSVIFLDPPYRLLTEQPERLRALAGRLVAHLSPDGLVVFRHDARDSLELPGLKLTDKRTYGGMVLEFLGQRRRT